MRCSGWTFVGGESNMRRLPLQVSPQALCARVKYSRRPNHALWRYLSL